MSDVTNTNNTITFKFHIPDDETLASYISIKGEKGEKGDPTKLSELENDTGFITNTVNDLANYYTKAQTDSAINTEVSALNVPEGFFSGTEAVSGQGIAITLDGTASASIAEIKLYGDMVQAGTPTPTPDSPVAIQVATGVQTVTVSDGDSQTQSYEIDLGDLELCKLGTYQDYIYKDSSNSKWYKKKSVEKLDVSGLTGWYYSNSTNFKTRASSIAGYVFPSSNSQIGLILCKDYTPANAGEIFLGTPDYGIGLSSDKGVVLRNKEITTMSGFTSYLANNQLYAYVALTNPADVEITDEALLEQLEALSKARSYDSATNITVSGSLPVLLYVEAFKNDWSGTVASVNKELADLDNEKADKSDTYTKDEIDTQLDGSYIIEDITVNEYYDEQKLTHYWISHIPHTDSDGNMIKMRLGLANDVENENLRADETARSFAKRKNATLCINAGLFNVYSGSAYKDYPLGAVIKDKNVVCDFRDAIWAEGVASHSYLQKNRMLGVSEDNSLQRFAYDAVVSDMLNAGVDYTVTGFGAFMQNGKLTSDLSHNSGTATTYEETEDSTPNINKIYFTLVEGEYIGHWRLETFEPDTTYYEQATGDFYAWQFLGQNTTTKDFYIFTCNGKGTTSELGMSFEQAVAIFQSLGVDYAFELDAGGSVGLYHNGIRLNNKTDEQTNASSKTDGKGYSEREMPTFLYFAKEPTTGADENTASAYKELSDLADRVYDLEVASAGNEVVNNSTLFIDNRTGGDQSAIGFMRDGEYAVTFIADYLQQGIWALWDNRRNKTVLRVYPEANDGIAYNGNKLALTYDRIPLSDSSTDLDNLPFNTGIVRLETGYNLANQPFTSGECYFYYIVQLGFYGNGYNQRTQIAIPVTKAGHVADGIKIRGFTDNWGAWRYQNQPYAVDTSGRPNSFLYDGLMCFDTTLNKPIWYYNGSWYDATGTAV